MNDKTFRTDTNGTEPKLRACEDRGGTRPEPLSVGRSDGASYEIVFADDFRDLSGRLAALGYAGRRIALVTDSHVAPLYADTVREALGAMPSDITQIVLPAGEENKTLENAARIYEALCRDRFDRKDMVIALGGGVPGDMAGFAAATYLRGIAWAQIPTSLLAQVDSSVGGKTGVDLGRAKNLIGAFHAPRLVYTAPRVLNTLSPRHFSNGMAEVIKHGLICDRGFADWLSENKEKILDRDPAVLAAMVRQSCRIKRDIVTEDPEEQGIRSLLNYGHTLGHAIETCSGFSLLHGECVGLGMLCAARIAAARGTSDPAAEEYVRRLLQAFGLPVRIGNTLVTAQDVLNAVRLDKKRDGDSLSFILIDQIGSARIDRTVTEVELTAALSCIGIPG